VVVNVTVFEQNMEEIWMAHPIMGSSQHQSARQRLGRRILGRIKPRIKSC
jgi:hypothetical protein